jgi:hypothetical protein
MTTKTVEATGAAIHHDLYREEPDPAAEAVEARKLGLGFVIVFSCLIGGLSLLLNQAASPDPVISIDGLGEGATIDDPSLFSLMWADGHRPLSEGAVKVDNAVDDLDDVTDSTGYAVVRLVSDRTLVATLYAPKIDSVPPSSVRFSTQGNRPGVDLPARPGYVHAWQEAKLFGTLPTRYFIYAGLWLGFVCMFPPLGVPLYTFWMGYVAKPLAWLNTRLILIVVFFLVFGPMALILAIRRGFSPQTDFLGRAPRPKDQTYWSERTPRERTHFERWF